MHPFDPGAALLAKHAQHVVLVHFPIALLLTGVGLDLASGWARRPALAAAAYCNLLVAAASTVPVVATGLLAWRLQLGGRPPHGVLLLHLLAGIAASLLIWAVWWIHRRARREPAAVLPSWRLPVELLAAALVALTGHLGGFLSGVNLAG